ncbi:MAG TPA: hypothetical protein VJN44_01800 [Roseateles sp.]|nr:hypothetical protein [Roseateles sp.]
MRITRLVLPALAAVLALSLAGCVVVPARPAYGGYVVDDGYRGQPPVVGYVWIDGFWTWQSGRRTWVDGHWGPPRHYRGRGR